MNVIFILTLGITILNLFSITSVIFSKSTIDFPHYKLLDVGTWFIFYPSFFYQVYWWSIYFKLI